MSTDEEFEKAFGLVNSCKASVSCGCEVSEYQSRLLYLCCRDYVKAYKKRFGQY